jgi:hypothetical protein
MDKSSSWTAPRNPAFRRLWIATVITGTSVAAHGALADKVHRQKLICFVNVGLAATAVGLAVLGWLHLLNPYLILVSVDCCDRLIKLYLAGAAVLFLTSLLLTRRLLINFAESLAQLRRTGGEGHGVSHSKNWARGLLHRCAPHHRTAMM